MWFLQALVITSKLLCSNLWQVVCCWYFVKFWKQWIDTIFNIISFYVYGQMIKCFCLFVCLCVWVCVCVLFLFCFALFCFCFQCFICVSGYLLYFSSLLISCLCLYQSIDGIADTGKTIWNVMNVLTHFVFLLYIFSWKRRDQGIEVECGTVE